jgi:hypothetical protein
MLYRTLRLFEDRERFMNVCRALKSLLAATGGRL